MCPGFHIVQHRQEGNSITKEEGGRGEEKKDGQEVKEWALLL